MSFVQSTNMHCRVTIFMLASTMSTLGCVQPAPNAPILPETPTPFSEKAMPSHTTNRIMARLDGLSGEADPRLLALKNRFAQLGMTVLSMGVVVNPSQNQAAVPNASKFTAFITVAIDPTKTDLPTALVQTRALETFSYVETDQLLQKRK